jgi:diguanylate cyclase (GGDEF)-like protein
MQQSTDNQRSDPLTKLPSAERCRADLEVLAEGAVSLGLVDLDWFGQWNAQSGRENGDSIIRAVADHLRVQFEGTGSAYRFGGDAIMVLLPGVEKEQGFLHIEEARRSFAESQSDALTFSGGVAAAPEDGSDPDTLIRKCSEALYRAKLSGRNKICLAREEKMVTKTVHYRQGQLEGISRLAKREGMNEASLLREALDDLLRKYNA